jgi:hypothetical protein
MTSVYLPTTKKWTLICSKKNQGGRIILLYFKYIKVRCSSLKSIKVHQSTLNYINTTSKYPIVILLIPSLELEQSFYSAIFKIAESLPSTESVPCNSRHSAPIKSHWFPGIPLNSGIRYNFCNFNWFQIKAIPAIPGLQSIPGILELGGIGRNSQEFRSIPLWLNARNSVPKLHPQTVDWPSNTTRCMWVRVETDSGTEFRELGQSRIRRNS